MTDIGKIIGQQAQDIDFIKAMLGNPQAAGSGVSWFKLREETIAISIGSCNILTKGLGSSFILGHTHGLGWLGTNAGSITVGSQPYLGDSKDVSWTFQQSGLNMVFTDDGVEVVRNFLGGQDIGSPSFIAIGSDATTPTAADTSLGSEFESSRYTFASVTSGAGYVEFEAVIPSTSPTEQPVYIYEMGLFDSGAANTGSMFSRSDFTGFWKADNVELQAVVRLNISGC